MRLGSWTTIQGSTRQTVSELTPCSIKNSTVSSRSICHKKVINLVLDFKHFFTLSEHNIDMPRPKQAPIMLSNLENSYLREHGDGFLDFNQNTVPFDFDGERLLWMTYKSREDREVYIYNFNSR